MNADYDLSERAKPAAGHYDVLLYFKKLENHWRGAGPYHGSDGSMAVAKMEGPGLMSEIFTKTAAAAGVPDCEDYNGADQDVIQRERI